MSGRLGEIDDTYKDQFFYVGRRDEPRCKFFSQSTYNANDFVWEILRLNRFEDVQMFLRDENSNDSTLFFQKMTHERMLPQNDSVSF